MVDPIQLFEAPMSKVVPDNYKDIKVILLMG